MPETERVALRRYQPVSTIQRSNGSLHLATSVARPFAHTSNHVVPSPDFRSAPQRKPSLGSKLVAFRRFATVILVTALHLAPIRATGQTIIYAVEGTLQQLSAMPEIPSLTHRFHATVSNCDWAIRVFLDPSAQLDRNSSVGREWWCLHKARSLFYYHLLHEQPVPGIINQGAATIEAGDVPRGDGIFAPIWLAFASSCAFHSATNGRILPIWVGRAKKPVKAEWSLFNGPPSLPQHVVYYQEPGLWSPPFENGWKAAEYRVLTGTNMGGLRIPIEAIYEESRPKAAGVTVNDLERTTQFRIRAAAIRSTGVSGLSLPNPPGVTVIHETRFPNLPPSLSGIQYLSTNKPLPEVPDRIAVAKYRAILRETGASYTGKSKTLPRAVFLGFLALSAGILALAAKKTQNTLPTQTGAKQ